VREAASAEQAGEAKKYFGYKSYSSKLKPGRESIGKVTTIILFFDRLFKTKSWPAPEPDAKPMEGSTAGTFKLKIDQ
jgi:hypothetical protein